MTEFTDNLKDAEDILDDIVRTSNGGNVSKALKAQSAVMAARIFLDITHAKYRVSYEDMWANGICGTVPTKSYDAALAKFEQLSNSPSITNCRMEIMHETNWIPMREVA